jgi:SAM-dependent methyltransferase
MYQCQICHLRGDHAKYMARETMYGWKETFEYFQCARCKCLQISKAPDDLERYYGTQYYSYDSKLGPRGLKRFLYIQRDRYAFTNQGLFGRWIYRRFPRLDYRFLSRLSLKKKDKILDIGCGSGLLLQSLSRVGFEELTGVDPFITQDIRYSRNVNILKKSIFQVSLKQDLVMFNHSLEHMPQQLDVMRTAANLLSERGVIVVRIPTVSSYAWRHYGIDWVQLDAPRHLFLHSEESIRMLGESAGLELFDTFYDSSAFQFWGSEQCRAGTALASPKSYAIDRSASMFSAQQIVDFENNAATLNHTKQGDQAAFYFRRKET